MYVQYITCIPIIWYLNDVSIHIYLICSSEYICPLFYENVTSWCKGKSILNLTKFCLNEFFVLIFLSTK